MCHLWVTEGIKKHFFESVESIPMRNKSDGSTLVELMIVVVIIGILASVGVSSYLNYIIKAKWAENITIANGLANKAMVCQQLYLASCLGNVGNTIPADVELTSWPVGKYMTSIGVIYHTGGRGFHIYMHGTNEVGAYTYSRGFTILSGNTSNYVATLGALDNVPVTVLDPLPLDSSY